MKAITLIVAATVALAACTSASPEPISEESASDQPVSADPVREESAVRGVSPLVIVDEGQVVVVEPDGSSRTPITSASGDFFFQPIWSPDGSTLAFSLTGSSPAILLAKPDGTATYSAATDTFPFYFSWSVRNELALLRNGAAGLTLDLTSVADESAATPRQIEAGQPLYFSWGPDGETIVTHVGADRLELNDFADSNPLGPQPGAFQSPVWTSDGIFAIERGAGDQSLVQVSDGESRRIAKVRGPTTMVATSDGSLVAIQSIVDSGDALTAAFQTLPTLPTNRVVVVDTGDSSHTTVSAGPALAYFWAPAGDRLLVLDIVPGPQARWSVWNGEESEEIIRFDPDPGFIRDLVPFFDQYSQSISLWAPDGSAFAFPGTIDGSSGIWVQQLEGGLDRISSGTWVSWSP